MRRTLFLFGMPPYDLLWPPGATPRFFSGGATVLGKLEQRGRDWEQDDSCSVEYF